VKGAWLGHVNHFSGTADRLRRCQLRWTISVVNWRPSSVTSLSHWPSTFCVQHGQREALRRAGLSATEETCSAIVTNVKCVYSIFICIDRKISTF